MSNIEDIDEVMRAYEHIRKSGSSNMLDVRTITPLINAMCENTRVTDRDVKSMVIRFMSGSAYKDALARVSV